MSSQRLLSCTATGFQSTKDFFEHVFTSCVTAGDYDGALSVFTEMQLMCQERGLQLPGTTTPVGEALIDVNKLVQFSVSVLHLSDVCKK